MMNFRRWRILSARCNACRMWHTVEGRTFYGNSDRHDRCIRRMPGVRFACCGHGDMRGYVAVARGVFRFPGDVHPTLIRAAAIRYRRTGVVPGWAREDGPDFPEFQITAGCRFRTGLDRRYRRKAANLISRRERNVRA